MTYNQISLKRVEFCGSCYFCVCSDSFPPSKLSASWNSEWACVANVVPVEIELEDAVGCSAYESCLDAETTLKNEINRVLGSLAIFSDNLNDSLLNDAYLVNCFAKIAPTLETAREYLINYLAVLAGSIKFTKLRIELKKEVV